MRARRSHAAQHMTLENVCTRVLPRSSHSPASGWSCIATARRPSGSSRSNSATSPRWVSRSSKNTCVAASIADAVHVVLDLPPGVVADAHRPHAAIAGQRVLGALVELARCR